MVPSPTQHVPPGTPGTPGTPGPPGTPGTPGTPGLRQATARPGDHRQTFSAAAVLQAALDHGPVARSTVARLAGLSPAAVSRLCTDLAGAGLLRDAPEAATA